MLPRVSDSWIVFLPNYEILRLITNSQRVRVVICFCGSLSLVSFLLISLKLLDS